MAPRLTSRYMAGHENSTILYIWGYRRQEGGNYLYILTISTARAPNKNGISSGGRGLGSVLTYRYVSRAYVCPVPSRFPSGNAQGVRVHLSTSSSRASELRFYTDGKRGEERVVSTSARLHRATRLGPNHGPRCYREIPPPAPGARGQLET